MKAFFLFLIILISATLLAGCTTQNNTPQSEKLKVVATFYPFYDITKNIGSEKIELSSIVPPSSGVEPHDYEPTSKDIINLNTSDVFITTGTEFAEFEDQLIKSLDKKVFVINASEGIEQIPANEALNEEDHIFVNDPHIWISAKNAQKIAQNIADGLAKADPKNAEYYRQNASAYIEKLKELDMEYKTRLSNCRKSTILTSHAAFGYLARDYNFNQIALLGLSPESEPTADQIKKIVNEARKYGIKYIFYEELVDPKVSEIIAKEVGAQTLLLSPIEGLTNKDSTETYISKMRGNLANLEVALECQK